MEGTGAGRAGPCGRQRTSGGAKDLGFCPQGDQSPGDLTQLLTGTLWGPLQGGKNGGGAKVVAGDQRGRNSTGPGGP